MHDEEEQEEEEPGLYQGFALELDHVAASLLDGSSSGSSSGSTGFRWADLQAMQAAGEGPQGRGGQQRAPHLVPLLSRFGLKAALQVANWAHERLPQVGGLGACGTDWEQRTPAGPGAAGAAASHQLQFQSVVQVYCSQAFVCMSLCKGLYRCFLVACAP